jgi:hypothetical protein
MPPQLPFYSYATATTLRHCLDTLQCLIGVQGASFFCYCFLREVDTPEHGINTPHIFLGVQGPAI